MAPVEWPSPATKLKKLPSASRRAYCMWMNASSSGRAGRPACSRIAWMQSAPRKPLATSAGV
ncbi:hypothetical protein [Sorangium sp. So ce1151]|uniref:hypothetical protein n=1 Tax=Sorangium sp. So ce1151 TaxID=3133332 RepID=UPI003F61BDEA